MNKKFFSMAVLAAMTMVGMNSCSNDDVTGPAAPDMPSTQFTEAVQGAIGYSITQDGAMGTRGTATTSANFLSQIANFQVFGYYNDGSGRYVGSSDVVGTIINGNGAGVWTYNNSNQVQFWPAKTLDFQAVTPASDASFVLVNTPNAGSPRLTANVTVPAVTADQKDIMFASTTNVNNATTGEAVGLTFKHALSQVVFAGKVTSEAISANVASIEIVNVHNTGNVGYREAVNSLSASATGTASATFSVGLVASPTVSSTTATNLTAANGALMMIPQSVNPWTTAPGAAVTTEEANTAHNAYLKIRCTVTDLNTGLNLIDNDYVYVPFDLSSANSKNWELGKKYTYTLVFGNGQGGYDEDGNPLTNLIPISYTVTTADDWTEVSADNVEF